MTCQGITCYKPRGQSATVYKKHQRLFREINVLAMMTRTSCPSRLCIPTIGLPCPRRSKVTSSDHWKKQRRSRIRSTTPLTSHLWTPPNHFGEYFHPVRILLAYLHFISNFWLRLYLDLHLHILMSCLFLLLLRTNVNSAPLTTQ